MTTITFWKDNRIDQEYELTLDEIKTKYRDFLKTKEQSWIEYYGHQTVSSFVGDKNGLSSVTDQENYDVLMKELMHVRHETYKKSVN